MRLRLGTPLLLSTLIGAAAIQPQAASASSTTLADRYDAVLAAIQALPYQPAYVPAGFDSAFGSQNVLNDAPAQDYTSGSIPGSPDNPAWPASFREVTLTSGDGAELTGWLSLQPGTHPGVVVVHGFNTHGYESVVRWAAMLAANGYDVLAADQRDYSAEYTAGYEGPAHDPQTFGWKESQDVLAAGRYLAAQPGVGAIGVVGFSEGAQNTVLALAQDTSHVFSAGITFSAPADQDTQIYSTAVPPACSTPSCSYPATGALVALVVPPYSYTDPCTPLANAATQYGTTGWNILADEDAMHAQQHVTVPLLNFYSGDDSLVPSFEAAMMAAFDRGSALHRTLEVSRGEHAYFYDRWWQQRAILTYFHGLLDGARATTTAAATVNQTPGGASFQSQEVPLTQTRAWANAQLAPYVCDTSQPPPG